MGRNSQRGRRPPLDDRLGTGDGLVKLAKPEGILLVAAGGPGMAESWIIFPHLAWAITQAVEGSAS